MSNYSYITFAGTTGYVSSGEIADHCTLVVSNNVIGALHIYDGGTAEETNVSDGGHLHVSSGGTAEETNVSGGGHLHVSSGGTAEETRVMAGGSVTVLGGGRSIDMTVSSGGVLNGFIIQEDTHYDFALHVANTQVTGTAFLYTGQTATGTILNGTGHMHVFSGASAIGITMNSGTHLEIHDGAKMTNLTIVSGGHAEVEGGLGVGVKISSGGHLGVYSGTADDVDVLFSGYMAVYSGGSAKRVKVSNGGALYVYSGGSAEVEFNPWRGRISSEAGGSVTILNRNAGVYIGNAERGLVSKTNSASGMSLANLSAIVYENGRADSMKITQGGMMTVSSGGRAASADVSDGNLYVSMGGIASAARVSENGSMLVSHGGLVSDTAVSSGGKVLVFSGGNAENTRISGIKGGVSSLLGKMEIKSGGTASGTSVASGGELHISAGAVHRGRLNIAQGGSVQAGGGIIDFTISAQSPGNSALITNFGLITGDPGYTISVSSSQSDGKYILAESVPSFPGTITVKSGSVRYGTLSLNDPELKYGDRIFRLDARGGILSLTVSSNSSSASSGPDDKTRISSPAGLSVSVGKYNAVLTWNRYGAGKGVSYAVSIDGNIDVTNRTRYTVRNLSIGPHKFAVRATLPNGTVSDWSAPVIRTVSDVTAPKTGALSLAQNGADSVLLTWGAASDNIGVDHYVVTCGNESRTVSGTKLSAEFSGLSGKVSASVTAYDADGNAGKTVRKTFRMKDVTPPSQVTGLRSEGVNNKSGGVLAWNAADDNVGVTQYLIAIEGGKTYKSKTNSVRIKKLPAGEYRFTVTALDKAKNRSTVSEACVFSVEDVIAPKIKKFSVKTYGNTAHAEWKATDETGIAKLELQLDGSKTFDVTNAASFDLNDLSAGPHRMRLTAYDAAGGLAVRETICGI